MNLRLVVPALAAAAALATPSPARAACSGTSLVVTHAGRLLDASDVPVDTSVALRFRLFSLASSADDRTALWDSGTCQVPVKKGLYALTLGDGCGQDLCASLFPAGQKRYLEVSVGETALSPRLLVTSVPFATLAADALALGGVPADQFRKKTDPVDANTFAGRNVPDFWLKADAVEAATFGGKAPADYWKKADAVDAATLGGRSPSQLQAENDGRYLRVQGGASATVAGDLAVGGNLTATKFMGSGAGLSDVDAAMLGGRTAADLDGRYALLSPSAAQTGSLNISGGAVFTQGVGARAFAGDGSQLTNVNATKLGGVDAANFQQKGALVALTLAASDPATCTSATEGQMYLNTSTHQPMLCLQGRWLPLLVANPYGQSASQPGASCLDIKTQVPIAPSGIYYVNPGGAGVMQVYCDMVTDGGGWTLVTQAIPVTNAALSLCTESAVGTLVLDDTTAPQPAKLASATINALWSSRRELLTKEEQDGTAASRSGWPRACIVDFKASYQFSAVNSTPNGLNDLDTTTIRCTTGSFSTGKVDSVYSGNQCGYGFQNSGTSDYVIYSFNTSYTGAACGTANAGRTWLGYGNSGCNVAKMFVR